MDIEIHRLVQENRNLNKKSKEYEFDLASMEKNREEQTYNLRLELEERGRKQMESYARELSIRYANQTDNETINRLKNTSNGILKEKKKLQKEVDFLTSELKKEKKTQRGGGVGDAGLQKRVVELEGKIEF